MICGKGRHCKRRVGASPRVTASGSPLAGTTRNGGRGAAAWVLPGGQRWEFLTRRGLGLGSWERIGHHQFEARFTFFLFNADGSHRGSEAVTNHSHLTDPGAFEATAICDLFHATGNRTSPRRDAPLPSQERGQSKLLSVAMWVTITRKLAIH